MSGKHIELFLVDGTPGGLTAEILNWTGQVLGAPRSEISALVCRAELAGHVACTYCSVPTSKAAPVATSARPTTSRHVFDTTT